MREVTEKHYFSKNGVKFDKKEDCLEYEALLDKQADDLSNQEEAELTSAKIEYLKDIKGKKYIKPVLSAGGNGHDGYFNKCPYCGELTGGYERLNTRLKVDDAIYQCCQCSNFFTYR